MGNVETNSNGRRDRQELITMRCLHREVQRYRVDNERIMKSQEEILQSLNMFHNQFKKGSGTNKSTSVIYVSISISHSKRDDHENERKSRSMSRFHHSPNKSTRTNHEISRLGSNPSVSHVRSQRSRPMVYILQVEL
jgi:hypothetical protein